MKATTDEIRKKHDISPEESKAGPKYWSVDKLHCIAMLCDEVEGLQAVKQWLTDETNRQENEIARLKQWIKADSNASKGEGHSMWCESQIAGHECNCPMRLHREIERLRKELKDFIETVELVDPGVYSDSIASAKEALLHE